MTDEQSEMQKFLGDLAPGDKPVQDIIQEVKEPTPAPEKEAEEDEESDGRKNRRHRRLEEKYQRERESNIALNERLKVLAETKVDREYSRPSEAPPEWTALYGSSVEAEKAWKVQERLLENVAVRAKEDAIREMEERQAQVNAEQMKAEQFIDSELEALEDKFNVDLTSNAPRAKKDRREFLELVGNLSPKNDDGTPSAYADFESSYEVFVKTRGQDKPETVNRAKEIAAKTMQKSGAVDNSKEAHDAQRAWLREQGINV